MSDEEEAVSEEELEPETTGETAKKAAAPKKPAEQEPANEGMTEGEKAMLAAKKRQEDEQTALLQDYEERRRIEREKEEEELKLLKEKQERRRLEREEEERQFQERLKQEEEARKQEEEERKAKVEAEKRKREEEKKKRQQMLAGSFASAIEGGAKTGGRNFTVPVKKEEKKDKFDNIFQAKQEMSLTREQQNEAKKTFMATVEPSVVFAGLKANDLREKIRQIHQRLCKLEAEKYDLEKRYERQQYDLKELNERQRQVFRTQALKKGVDPSDTLSTRHPPKVTLMNKYERQIDRRNFAERRAMYENKNAHPCFPNVPPPPALYEKVILSFDQPKQEDAEEAGQEEEVEEEEEE